MATFLQLVNDLERESGTIHQGSRLQTVVGAPGRQEKMVEWIAQAWVMIQLARSDWPWLRSEFENALTALQPRYSAAQLGLADHAQWVRPADSYSPYSLFDPALGRKDETELGWMPMPAFKLAYDRGVHDANRPSVVAIDANGRLCLGSTPDKAYTLRGEYYRSAQRLTVDGDVPLCPQAHHDVIVWRALMLLGDHDEAPAVVSTATAKYQRAFRDLVDASMDEVTL